MKLDLRSAAIGAILAIGAVVLLSAQAAPALRSVADILAVKVQGAVEIRPQAGPLVRVNTLTDQGSPSSPTAFLLYTVPEGQNAVIRTIRGKWTSGGGSGGSVYRVVDPQFNVYPGPSPDLELIDSFSEGSGWESPVGGTAPAAYHLVAGEEVWAWGHSGNNNLQTPYYVEFELLPTQ